MNERASGREFQTSVRVAPAVKERLRNAAETAGRSLSAEMQVRLERSVLDDEREPLRGDPMIRMIASVVDLIQRKTERRWWDDAQTADACRQAISDLMIMLPTRESEKALGAAFNPLNTKAITRTAIEEEAALCAARDSFRDTASTALQIESRSRRKTK